MLMLHKRMLFQIHTALPTEALAKICRRRPPVCCTLYDTWSNKDSSPLQHASSSSFPQHRHIVYLCASAVRLHIQSAAEIKAAPRHLHHRLTKKHWAQPLPHTDAFLDDTSHQGHLTWTGTERSMRDRGFLLTPLQPGRFLVKQQYPCRKQFPCHACEQTTPKRTQILPDSQTQNTNSFWYWEQPE